MRVMASAKCGVHATAAWTCWLFSSERCSSSMEDAGSEATSTCEWGGSSAPFGSGSRSLAPFFASREVVPVSVSAEVLRQSVTAIGSSKCVAATPEAECLKPFFYFSERHLRAGDESGM